MIEKLSPRETNKNKPRAEKLEDHIEKKNLKKVEKST